MDSGYTNKAKDISTSAVWQKVHGTFMQYIFEPR